MPNSYFQIYNHAYSFATSKVFSAGVTYSLPQNDYGIYGQHVDALFNSLSNDIGGTGNLVACFVSDAGLTYFSNALGASAAVTGYIQSKFPVTNSTSGLGIIDLQGSSDWVQIIGDGIIGPARGSTASIALSNNCQKYINGVTTLFGQLSTRYPNIKWAIAGLPHLPFETVYAPLSGNAPLWDKSLTNGTTGNATWWDAQHPTGGSAESSLLYTWENIPSELSAFYQTVVNNGPQRQVLDNCNIGWMCPDIRVPQTTSLPFYSYGYSPLANYKRNEKLVDMASQYGKSKLAVTYPLISSTYPSRAMTQYDDYGGEYSESYLRETEQDGSYWDIGGTSYIGTTGNAANSYYPLITFRLDMIDAAVMGGADGFVYRDGIPSMIEATCTGNVSENNSLYSLQTRSRNMFSNMLYGGAYSDGYSPIGGYTDTNAKRELLRFCSNETMGYLNEIRESVNVSRYDTQKSQSAAGANGWMRSAQNPTAPKTFSAVQLEIQLSEGVDVFGGQSWGADSGGANNCNCPPPDLCAGPPPVDCTAQLCTSCVEGNCIDDPNDGCDPNIPICCQSTEFCISVWDGFQCITTPI